MTPQKTAQSFSSIILVITLGLVPLLVGCQSLPALRKSHAWHGNTPIYATYQFGILTAEIPPGYSIESVHAVTRAVLYRQGNTIESSTVSPQGGRIVALGAKPLPYDKIKIDTSFQGAGIVITINLDPAEENRARVVLESILQSLDL
jgi:hypothetical protein